MSTNIKQRRPFSFVIIIIISHNKSCIMLNLQRKIVKTERKFDS